MAVKIFFFFYILNITKIWLNMVVNDSLVSKVRKGGGGVRGKKNIIRVVFPSKIHLELMIFSKKYLSRKLGIFFTNVRI